MNRAHIIVPAVLALMAGCGPQSGNHDQMVASAKELDRRFIAAFNNHDLDAMMENYWKSPDLVVYPGATLEATGWEAVRSMFGTELPAMTGTLELLDAHYMVAGDVVIGYGKWRVTMRGPDGSPMDFTGRYTDVKAERDGKWVYVLDHASVPIPPADEAGNQ